MTVCLMLYVTPMSLTVYEDADTVTELVGMLAMDAVTPVTVPTATRLASVVL